MKKDILNYINKNYSVEDYVEPKTKEEFINVLEYMIINCNLLFNGLMAKNYIEYIKQYGI